MKQFDLDEYLANPSKKVVTRDGKSARIVCTDRVAPEYKLVALVMKDDTECMCAYNTNGCVYKNDTHALDLFFAPEKHEGWTPVYREPTGKIRFGNAYSTQKEAEEASKYDTRYLTTTKVEWEE